MNSNTEYSHNLDDTTSNTFTKHLREGEVCRDLISSEGQYHVGIMRCLHLRWLIVFVMVEC